MSQDTNSQLWHDLFLPFRRHKCWAAFDSDSGLSLLISSFNRLGLGA